MHLGCARLPGEFITKVADSFCNNYKIVYYQRTELRAEQISKRYFPGVDTKMDFHPKFNDG
jgi:hypothetical protein